MARIEVGTEGICYPMPCSLVGCNVEGKPTFLTVAWFSMVNPKPPYIMISLGKHYSNPGIIGNGTFSVNIPSVSMVEETDYCGIASGKKYDKSGLFKVFYGKLGSAPMIDDCPYSMECKLVKRVELPAEEMFIGEIVAAYADERFLTNGVPDLAKMQPFVLSIADRRYLGLGAEVGKAWEAGKKLMGK